MTATTVFLSYARKDGAEAAVRLRGELERSGFEVWRDLEDMRGGQAWKNQLRQAIKAVDAVLVILTPSAVASKNVEWEWETALTLEKRVIPLLIKPCEVPQDLGRLHFHRLDSEQEYVSGFARLIRDLIQLSVGAAEVAEPKSEVADEARGSRSVSIGGDSRGNTIVTGDGNTVGSNNTVQNVTQRGKYNVNLGSAENLRIGDTIEPDSE